MNDDDLMIRKVLVSRRRRAAEARRLQAQEVTRLYERDPETGLYCVAKPFSSTKLLKGEKIYSRVNEPGEVVRSTRPFGSAIEQVDETPASGRARLRSVLSGNAGVLAIGPDGKPILGHDCPGYLRGQIFNCELPYLKPLKPLEKKRQFTPLARSEGFISIEGTSYGDTDLYTLVPGSADWASGIADVTPPISYSETVSLPLSGNTLTYSTEFNTGECLLTFEFECSLDFRIDAQFEAQVARPGTDYNVQIEEQIDSGGWAVVFSDTLTSLGTALPNGLYMLRRGGLGSIQFHRDYGSPLSVPCSTTDPRKYEYRFTYQEA